MKNNKAQLLTLLFITFTCLTITGFAQSIKIKIIETSDVHGAIYPYNFTGNKTANHSLAQVATYIKEERAKSEHKIILVDNGDILQGDPSVYYYNFEKTDTTHLLARVMNYMKYDVGSVGNHDIETGHPVYDKFNDELDFPWLAANAINTQTGETYFPPYHIIEKDASTRLSKNRKIKIAVLGMITPGIPNWLPKNIWSGIDFEDMITTAKKWIPIIKGKENPDIIIGVFHSGIDFTYDNQNSETPRNENASQLVAEQVPGFDIVFVGHDHHEWNKNIVNVVGDTVLILGPAARANSITVATIDLNFNKQNKSWNKKITGEIINIREFEPDKKFQNKFISEFKEIKDYVSKPIGTFTESISARESLFGNSSFVDLIHKIQLDLSGADISFTAPLSIHSQISKGDVFIRDMFNLYRYENLLYTMELSGKEILDYLEYSYASWFNTMKNPEDNLLLFVKDENGELILSKRSNAPMLKNRYYNFDSAEGIKYTVNISKPIGKRVNIISMSDGKLFKLNKKYRVAINSYRGNGGGGHLVDGAGIPKNELANRILTSTEKDLRYYMMKWIEQQGTVLPQENVNWQIEPKDLVEAAKKRDYDLMFGNN